jgi:hypothetical protein
MGRAPESCACAKAGIAIATATAMAIPFKKCFMRLFSAAFLLDDMLESSEPDRRHSDLTSATILPFR